MSPFTDLFGVGAGDACTRIGDTRVEAGLANTAVLTSGTTCTVVFLAITVDTDFACVASD